MWLFFKHRCAGLQLNVFFFFFWHLYYFLKKLMVLFIPNFHIWGSTIWLFYMVFILLYFFQSKPMTQATMAGLGLLTFYQYLIHVVVHEKAILNMLGMFMFVVATVTWATPVMEIVSVKSRLRNHCSFYTPCKQSWRNIYFTQRLLRSEDVMIFKFKVTIRKSA